MVITAGHRIKRWREAKGLTIRQLAKLTGIPKSRIQRIEVGRSEPRASELELISESCGVSLPRFFGHLPAERSDSAERAA